MTCHYSWNLSVKNLGVKISHGTKTDETVNLIEFWSFIPLFLFFNTSISGFEDVSAQVTAGLVLRIYTGQDAFAQVTESLTLTECKFLPKAILYILDNSVDL